MCGEKACNEYVWLGTSAGIIVDTFNGLHLSWKIEIRNRNRKTSGYFDVLVIILRVAKKEFVEK